MTHYSLDLAVRPIKRVAWLPLEGGSGLRGIRTALRSLLLAIWLRRIIVAMFSLAAIAASVGLLVPAQSMALGLDAGSQNVVAAAPNGQSVAQEATKRAKDAWTWYIVRASGLIGAVLLVLLMLSGMGLVTGSTYWFWEPLTAWAVHRAMGIALLWSIAVHMGVLLIDKLYSFRPVDLFVPFLTAGKSYPDLGKWGLGIGLGVLATYMSVAVVAASLLWINKRVRVWRLIHYVSYPLIAAVFIHGLFTGTDISKGYARILWIAGGIAIVGGIIARLFRAGTISGGGK